jgi:hypothetical protein
LDASLAGFWWPFHESRGDMAAMLSIRLKRETFL